MSKAEERALKEYPYKEGYDVELPYPSTYDENKDQREAYIKGYHQAEKDNAMTWEDMRELYIIFAEVDAEIELCKADNITAETIGYYQEVLKRFKNMKDGTTSK